MRVFAPLVLILTSAGGFQYQPPKNHQLNSEKDLLSNAVAIGIAAASSLLVTNISPHAANAVTDDVYGSLEKAIIEASDASFPVLESLTAETVNPLSKKVASLLTKKVPAEQLTTAIDGTADTLLSIPAEKVATFIDAVKESYQGISTETCKSIPIPIEATSLLSTSEAFSKSSGEKIKQVSDQIVSPLVQSIPYNADQGKICLPSQEGLEKIWIGQTKLFLSIPTPAKQQFAADLVPVVKSIPPSDLLRVLPDAKKIVGGVDRKQAFKFQEKAKALDTALKQDYRFKALQNL